ncbi:MAG: O-antigen ligase family protein, partial [Planctomycetota bacterium]|nr:O-antigen ligase family protein [Planctomycetota bacterium]
MKNPSEMHRHVPVRVSWIASIWVGVILAMATLVFCRIAESDRFPASSPALSKLTAVLTVPITMARPADLRQYSLPIGLAGLLIFFALYAPPWTKGDDEIKRDDGEISADRFVHWFAACGAAVVAIAVGSALYNDSWDFSKGWIFHLTVGLGWALLIGRLASVEMVERILLGGFVVALVAIGLSFWHRDLSGLRDVQWPIGPVTITAALGALWAAAAVGRSAALLLARSSEARTSRVAIGLTILALVLSLLLLLNAGRRAGWLGLAAAVAFLILTLSWKGRSRRAVRFGIAPTVLALAGLGAWWLVTQAASPVREVGGSIALRTAVWQRTIELTSDGLLLGHGPDMFVCEMTTAMARAKAETPHLLHGEIAAAAHNEWLQSVFELGVIGGPAYLALPLIAIVGGLATLFGLPKNGRGLQAIPVCAGLVAIVVVESVSINLRNPIMPAWYWTFMGLALACSRGTAGRGIRLPDWAPRDSVLRFVVCGVATVILLVVFNDMLSGTERARVRRFRGPDRLRATAEALRPAVDRLGARQCLEAGIALARARSDVVRGIRDTGSGTTDSPRLELGREHARWSQSAVEAWEEVSKRSPGYPGVGVGLAEALMDAGRLDDARETLERILRDVDPYDARANLLYVRFLEDDRAGRLQCVRRAVRDGAITEEMLDVVEACLREPEAAAAWSSGVTEAERSVSASAESDKSAPEDLRIEAARLDRRGDAVGAARLQATAARAYLRLYESNDAHRRPADAEWDAWYRAAEYSYRA